LRYAWSVPVTESALAVGTAVADDIMYLLTENGDLIELRTR